MKKKPLIVFGTGQQSDIISFYLKKMSRKIELYCVDDNHLKGNSFNKKGIISTTTLLKKYKPKDYNMHIAISYSELNSIKSPLRFLSFSIIRFKFTPPLKKNIEC